jgi:hypothetical protein
MTTKPGKCSGKELADAGSFFCPNPGARSSSSEQLFVQRRGRRVRVAAACVKLLTLKTVFSCCISETNFLYYKSKTKQIGD